MSSLPDPAALRRLVYTLLIAVAAAHAGGGRILAAETCFWLVYHRASGGSRSYHRADDQLAAAVGVSGALGRIGGTLRHNGLGPTLRPGCRLFRDAADPVSHHI